MRVISGIAKGIVLDKLSGLDIRPTTDKVKQAIFNAIQFDIYDAKVLDLFSGTGQFGIEALSRGAKSCTFVDISSKSISIVKSNLFKTKLYDKAELVNSNAIEFIKSIDEIYDIVFLDPPYNKGYLEQILIKLHNNINFGGIIICEHPKSQYLNNIQFEFQYTKTYTHGDICFTIYIK